ncbi:MAG: hypothetical protein M1377_05040 [Deltaproteobacteria bacterium]|nr:hypothetical protein [Deltaproteobacteria bacterium]
MKLQGSEIKRLLQSGDFMILKEITLPSTVGGSLDLRGCDLKGITLPAKFKNKVVK